MLKNYLKITWRSVVKDKYYSAISFLGLSVGLSFFALLILFLINEFNYDTMYKDSDRIYRTILIDKQGGSETQNSQLPLPFSDIARENILSIEQITKVFGAPQQIVETELQRGRLDDIVISDKYFFDIFDLGLKIGNSSTALDNEMSIVLSQETARRYFGEVNPVGETIDLENYGLFTVTGVLNQFPENSSFRFNAIMNANIDRYLQGFTGRQWFVDYYTGWNGRVAHNYVKLREGANVDQFLAQVEALKQNYFTENAEEIGFGLQPIADMHFKSESIQSNLSEVNGRPGNILYVYIFTAVAFLILGIACINYMNLSSARSIKRTSEVGIRNVLGAGKKQIIAQFLSQSVFISFLSIVPAACLLQIMIPYFKVLTGIQLTLDAASITKLAAYVLPSVVIIGLFSGLYPSLMLSRLKLSETVKQKGGFSVQGSVFRKGLVMGQFALTYVIIVITLIAGNQLNYIFDKELGFNEDQIVVMEISDGRLRNYIPDLKQAVVKESNVLGIAGLTRMFSGYREPQRIELYREGRMDENFSFSFYGFDEDVVPVMELEIVEGRNFLGKGSITLDSTTVLINEMAAKRLFPGSSPIGKSISITEPDNLEATVVGVVKDFHYQSLHVPIEPLVLGYIRNPIVGIDDFAIRISGSDIPATIQSIEETVGQFIEIDEAAGLEYQFLDSMIDDYYQADLTYRKLFNVAALIALLLSTIGLVGLTAFYSEMRTKEFGIRKILGASLKDLVSLQTSFFLKLIVIAVIIGIPVSMLTANQWLQNFSYQAGINAFPFLLAAISTLLVALLPIAFIAYKNSINNPVESLRSE